MDKNILEKCLGFVLSIVLLTASFSACNSKPPMEIPPDIDNNTNNISNSNSNTIYESSANNIHDSNAMNTHIEIYKSDRILRLYVEDKLIYTFDIALGSSPEGDKNKQGDKRTPTGSYYVCTRNEQSRFTLSLGVSYPNASDAKRGLENGLINEATFESIVKAEESKTLPPWQTPLGGEIGIHGVGNKSDWTLGCIALSDDDKRTLWQYVKLKTPINIYE
jgi:murein L,D-transpeptidase YafK